MCYAFSKYREASVRASISNVGAIGSWCDAIQSWLTQFSLIRISPWQTRGWCIVLTFKCKNDVEQLDFGIVQGL
jgi:hypothetical protein